MTLRRIIFLVLPLVLIAAVAARSLGRGGEQLDLSFSQLIARVESTPDQFEEVVRDGQREARPR